MDFGIQQVAGRCFQLSDVVCAFAEIAVCHHRDAVCICDDLIGNDSAITLRDFIFSAFQRFIRLSAVLDEIEFYRRRIIED